MVPEIEASIRKTGFILNLVEKDSPVL